MAFSPQQIIASKRDGEALSRDDLAHFAAGLADGSVSDAQASAFAMAVFLKGMDADEIVALTLGMRDSGTVLRWPDLPGPVVDKHSTGGVGDNVSLMLAPMLAACGCYVPMISGRGLGHSGGTLDKLESIPGYDCRPDGARFQRLVREVGCAIVGQTADLAPADGRLYAIRDVTATVESMPLITASILSKKLAAGLDALVLDVKLGNGAFLPEPDRARALAAMLVEVANGAGIACSALLTDMNQPLASAAGNAVELRNAIDFLTGEQRDARLGEIVLALGETVLVSSRRFADAAEARRALQQSLDTGAAVDRFSRMVAALGGPHDLVECPASYLPSAPVIRDVVAEGLGGMVEVIDTRAIGMAIVALGGGRRRPDDRIDHAVGFDRLLAIGDGVQPGQALGRVHARNEADALAAALSLRAAYAIGAAGSRPKLVYGHIRREPA